MRIVTGSRLACRPTGRTGSTNAPSNSAPNIGSSVINYFPLCLGRDRHLKVESSQDSKDTETTEPNGSSPPHHRVVFRASTNRSVIVRVLCILSMALVCVLGVVQAVHTHPENSTASHHSCSICSTAHAGLRTQTIAAAPVLTAAALATPARELAKTFRPSTVHFIRPPPAA